MPTNPFDINTPQTTQQAPGALTPPTAPQIQTQQATPTREGQAALSTAQRTAVDPATQTVQGQLAGILASGNPLLVQAQTRAKQEANKRGLLNSSMAVGAGESALYDAAMPIASQDAETFARFSLSDADRAQQADLANTAARNDMERLNVSEQGTTNRFNVDQGNVSARQAADSQTKLMLQQMDANTRVEMTNIEANYRTLMQASQSASDLYQQTLKNMSDIVANKDMNAAAKDAAIAQQKEFLRNGMNLIGAMNNLGIEELLVFGPSTPTPEPVSAPATNNPGWTGGYDGGY